MAFRHPRTDSPTEDSWGAAEARLLYLSLRDVERLGVSETEVGAAIEALFLEKGAGRVEAPPKLGVHPGCESFLHAMPAHVPCLRATGVKWVGVVPANPARGLPQVSGLILVNDPDTALPVAVLDAGWVTAQRTAAASRLAAKHLARSGATRVGILGCGAQGRSHLTALCAQLGVEEAVAYDPSSAARTKYAEEMQDKEGIGVRATSVPREAVVDCDVVVTSGPIARVPYATIPAGWLAPGALALSIDYASAWSPAALAEFDRVYTDDVPQLESERRGGYFAALPEPYGDLGEVVVGKKPGRVTHAERLMACLLGLAAEDVVVARLVVERAVAAGIGMWLPR